MVEAQIDKEIQQRINEIQKKFKEIPTLERVFAFSTEIVYKYGRGSYTMGLQELKDEFGQVVTATEADNKIGTVTK